MKRPFIIGIGGAYSGAGKTTLAAAILKYLTTHPPIYPFTHLPKTGAIKYTRTAFYTSITDDKALLEQKGKDTKRLLDASAEEVLWVQSPAGGIEEALPAALDRLSHLDCVIVEGNSAIEFLKPDIVIFLRGNSGERLKPSAQRILKLADIVISGESAAKDNDKGLNENSPLSVISRLSLNIEELANRIEMTAKKKNIEALLKQGTVDGGITCSLARKIAEELGVSYKEVGRAADALKIKIRNCELGCF